MLGADLAHLRLRYSTGTRASGPGTARTSSISEGWLGTLSRMAPLIVPRTIASAMIALVGWGRAGPPAAAIARLRRRRESHRGTAEDPCAVLLFVAGTLSPRDAATAIGCLLNVAQAPIAFYGMIRFDSFVLRNHEFPWPRSASRAKEETSCKSTQLLWAGAVVAYPPEASSRHAPPSHTPHVVITTARAGTRLAAEATPTAQLLSIARCGGSDLSSTSRRPAGALCSVSRSALFPWRPFRRRLSSAAVLAPVLTLSAPVGLLGRGRGTSRRLSLVHPGGSPPALLCVAGFPRGPPHGAHPTSRLLERLSSRSRWRARSPPPIDSLMTTSRARARNVGGVGTVRPSLAESPLRCESPDARPEAASGAVFAKRCCSSRTILTTPDDAGLHRATTAGAVKYLPSGRQSLVYWVDACGRLIGHRANRGGGLLFTLTCRWRARPVPATRSRTVPAPVAQCRPVPEVHRCR